MVIQTEVGTFVMRRGEIREKSTLEKQGLHRIQRKYELLLAGALYVYSDALWPITNKILTIFCCFQEMAGSLLFANGLF